MHILHVVGARPNFMKAAPVLRALSGHDAVVQTLVHTGQHYDANMSDIFFRQLGMPKPDINLGVGSHSHSRQQAEIMSRFELVALQCKPDLVLVYGDVNSTLAAALVGANLLIPVGHVEAGLRSFDRTMREETNRLVTDQISDLLFTPSSDADQNLLREGIGSEKIHFVGNVMIDTLVRLLPIAEKSAILSNLGLKARGYALVTLHRPSNVDDPTMLISLMEALDDMSCHLTVVFPVHPRTRRCLEKSYGSSPNSNMRLIEPLGYVDFLALERHAVLAITDSGGIQEETTFLGVPCITVRENTERPVTVSLGTNIVIGRDAGRLRAETHGILAGNGKQGQVPPLWDGYAAERIANTIVSGRDAGQSWM
jgi:UDP-N-acetylglucosamine 2-epimerase (non-hydrolysing)